ncbi:MAG: LptF/LptG family permease, partial [Deltaproteobacteria bacterium]
AEDILSKHVSFPNVVLLILYSLPAIVAISFPFASLVGSLMAVGRLSSDNEMLAFQASGVPNRRVFAPILILSVAFSLFSFIMNDYFLPLGNIRLGQVVLVLLAILLAVGWSRLSVFYLAILAAVAVLVLVAMLLQGRQRSSGSFSLFNVQLFNVDAVIISLIDIMLCFPSFFLILTVVALLPASIYNIMIVIGLTSWMGAARFVRAEFLSLREQDFVTAARALGVSDWRIIFRHMVPNAIAPVLVSATIGIAGAILTEAGLSFLGFGVPPPHATWGNILSDGKNYLFDAPWLTIIPGAAILVVVLSFNLFGEGLRDILNPKLKERH